MTNITSTNEKFPIKKKEYEVKHFESPANFLKWNELHKDELKDLKINTINKMISIPDYKLGLRNNQLTIIETKNKSKQNLRMRVERLEDRQDELINNYNNLLKVIQELTNTMNS
jgi:hypothetical protein